MKTWLRDVLLVVVGGLLFGTGPAVAAPDNDGIWREVRETDIARNQHARLILPSRYRTFELDRSRLQQRLALAPLERNPGASHGPLEISLPRPDGRYESFRVVESPIMEAALAAKYPQLKTYLGQGLEDPSATLRFDLTHRGFHAQVISAEGSWYVDPFQQEDLDHYIVYRKLDHRHGERAVCGVTGEAVDPKAAVTSSKVSSGASLRTYRLAMAATGEYTAFHGGSVVDGLAGIVTTLNRVNGIYEREVSVRMVLVANNDSIIYTDAVGDPYTNNNGSAMLTQNQNNLTSAIGSANYDIGHVVSTGGGGVAVLNSPCNAGNKAQGVTGSGSPVGDAFDVDYVAHEIGHQFGGGHTFNGAGANCAGGNRSASSAYEPGSGITIQAYAGICGGDDLQPNSEDYFHRRSLNQILAFTTNAATGASCGTQTATGNTVPTVVSQAAMTIPGRTPFTLTAAGSDGNGDTLTYLWEQFDLGPRNAEGVLNGAVASGPIFRSFTPTLSGSRTFPSWRYILNNANVPPATAPLPGTASPSYMTGEVLANVDRTLNFRVTVRDNRAGGGGTNEASTAITVDNDAGPFVITAPNTAITLAAGAATTVIWDVANTNVAPVGTADVRITLSTDGGITFPTELLASTPNDGSQSVTLPNSTETTQARVRVEAVGNIYFDVSDTNFTITQAGNTPPTLNVIGSVSTRQGSPATAAVVATIGDAQDSAGSLLVSVEGAPPELLVSAANSAGSVGLTAMATCSLVAPGGSKTYPVLLRVTDSAGAQITGAANVLVSRNLVPTLGSYANASVERGAAINVAPAVAPADGNNNLAAPTILPTTLPGGGTVSIAANGATTVSTTTGTALGVHTLRAFANDTCGATDVQQFTVTVTPPVTPGVTIAPSGGSTSVTEGGSTDSYTVVLNTAPSADVLISTSADSQISTSGNLTFTSENWNVAQTVTVTAINDAIVEGAHTGTITHAASGGGYSGISIASVVASVTDNDSGGVTITASGGSTDVTEDGATDGHAVVLTAQPSADVLISISADSQVSTSGNPTFTSANWNVAQTVTVTAINDAIVEGAHTGTITHAASGGGYSGISIASVVASVTDNDSGGVTITASGGSTDVTEDGATDGHAVVLTAQPSADVLISISADSQVSTSGNPTFTSANWNVAQTVTVTAINDAIVEGAHTGMITHAASGGGYSGIPISSVVANITDNDVAGVAIIQSGGSTDVAEGGATDSYTLKLTAQPSGDVLVTVSPDAQVATSGNLVFTSVNWSTAQTVTVTAVDDTVVEGGHVGAIAHVASGGGYDGAGIAGVIANISDDDATPVDLAVVSLSLRIPVAGERMSWEVVVDNLSATDVSTAGFEFSLPPALSNVSWLCVADAGAACPGSGSGAPSHPVVLAGNTGVLYRIGADVPPGTPIGTDLVTAASIVVTTPFLDTVSANNTDSTVDAVREASVLADGFETPR